MKTYKVTFREYRISMHEVLVNVPASDAGEAERFARNGQGAVMSNAEVRSVRAGELSGYLDYEVGIRFLPFDVIKTSIVEMA